jgi:hypothetical protein
MPYFFSCAWKTIFQGKVITLNDGTGGHRTLVSIRLPRLPA